MSRQSSATLRQRGSRTAAASDTTPSQQQASAQEELTTKDKLHWYFAQHVGLVCCVIGVALLALGYDKGWMHNTHLCIASLGLCLVGLFFHEFRPYNVSAQML